jgi:uncharacterized protein YbjQ (UPF0145 family)
MSQFDDDDSEKKEFTKLTDLEPIDSAGDEFNSPLSDDFLTEASPQEEILEFESLDELPSLNPSLDDSILDDDFRTSPSPPSSSDDFFGEPESSHSHGFEESFPSELPPEPSVAIAQTSEESMELESPDLLELLDESPAGAELQSKEQRKSPAPNLNQPTNPINAQLPFSVLIHGKLSEVDQARMIELLTEAGVGIRPLELEPQFSAGKILIPRVSEYVAIQIIQTFRDAPVQMKTAPSDQIFSTEDTKSTEEETIPPSLFSTDRFSTSEDSSSLSDIVITTTQKIPGHSHFEVVDAISAVATMSSERVEAENSAEYQNLIDALKKELRSKARIRKANAIIHFQTTLSRLTLPSQYQIVVSGTAIRLGMKDISKEI